MPLFIRRITTPDVVEADQVGHGASIHPGQGNRTPRPGDWVVTNHRTGQVQVLTTEEFGAQYEAAPIPQSMLAPTPGEGPEFQPQQQLDPAQLSAAPEVEPPVQTPQGPVEVFSASGPSTPMNEGLVGRPAPTPEVRPRLESPEPIETPTGLVEQPGDADTQFHEAETQQAEAEQEPDLETDPGPGPDPESDEDADDSAQPG